MVEGADLFCYECRENYKKGYDPLNSPCLNNVSLVNIRQCLPEHKYCQVSIVTFADKLPETLIQLVIQHI